MLRTKLKMLRAWALGAALLVVVVHISKPATKVEKVNSPGILRRLLSGLTQPSGLVDQASISPQPPPATQDSKSYKCNERDRWVEGVSTLYIITPTYPRAEQIPELTRTAQTLMHISNLVWIVAEDAPSPSPRVVQFLNESVLSTVYLRAEMPSKYLRQKVKPRGVANRMAGLQWVRKNAKEGVLYFADDDNTYDIRIFEQMRSTKKVSMFPVGLVTSLGVSTPIVRDGKVIGFYDGWIANRKFPVDMASFAVNVQFLHERPEAAMPFHAGYEEDGFMKSLNITPSEIEPLADNCTKIWVWHTQTKKNKPAKPVKSSNTTMGTNLEALKVLIF